ncbi:DUF2917 domain-containing protein [Pelomicrobium sp.]|uniref:DUF2917 domain-containing protein n=1 Tax=Pelomicrobium sp. TaxID=2815319 RepID=UPI003FA7480D
MLRPIHVAFRPAGCRLADRLRRWLPGLFPLFGTRDVHCVPAVAIPFDHRVVHLAKGQLLAIRDGSGCIVRCSSVELWITLDASSQDLVVRAPEGFVLDRPGLPLVDMDATRGSP